MRIKQTIHNLHLEFDCEYTSIKVIYINDDHSEQYTTIDIYNDCWHFFNDLFFKENKDKIVEEVLRTVTSNNKLAAVKTIKYILHISLKDAKDIVDNHTVQPSSTNTIESVEQVELESKDYIDLDF